MFELLGLILFPQWRSGYIFPLLLKWCSSNHLNRCWVIQKALHILQIKASNNFTSMYSSVSAHTQGSEHSERVFLSFFFKKEHFQQSQIFMHYTCQNPDNTQIEALWEIRKLE